MIFQIVSPFVTTIEGDSFKEAIKNYVKFNQNLNVTNLIIRDQADHYEARLRYYTENQKNKVGIDVYPYTNVDPYNNFYQDASYVVPVQPITASIVSPIQQVVAPFNSVVAPFQQVVVPPVISQKNSQFFATDSNIYVKRPNLD